MSGNKDTKKWCTDVADYISQLGLVSAVSGDQEKRPTAAQMNHMSLQELLRDPVWTVMYRRGWDDREEANIQQTKLSRPAEKTRFAGISGRSALIAKKPETVEKSSLCRKFQAVPKEKRKAREPLVSQQYRLAKKPVPTSNPEAILPKTHPAETHHAEA